MIRALLVVALLAGCGGGMPPASLSLSDLDAMAGLIELQVDEVTEAMCDAAGDGAVANCYIGIDTADPRAAEDLLCGPVTAAVEERTSGVVNLIAFNAADDQVTVPLPDCDE